MEMLSNYFIDCWINAGGYFGDKKYYRMKKVSRHMHQGIVIFGYINNQIVFWNSYYFFVFLFCT